MCRDALERNGILMKSQYKFYFCILARATMLFASILGALLLVAFPAWQGQPRLVTKGMSVAATTDPFLHRPYYGNQTILQRTSSFFDHDKPWYVDDHRFVRFDGAIWPHTSI